MTLINLPGYQLSEQIYNSARTLVYRGIRSADSLSVIIKLLKNPYPSFNELVQFRNQYTVTKNLHSPLIIQVYDLEVYQNGYVLVMEDFGGISLFEWWKKEKNGRTLREFLEIAISLCSSLEILYYNQILHKDIKPSNILINPETKQVKLIDFSIASLLPRETQTLISTNVLEGTLAYMSPEQTGRMNRGIDYRSDFYSLGVTFYELLTGELPFPSNELMELVHCHIAKIAPAANHVNPEIPSVISEIVYKLMAKNAEDRYQSALGIKFDLEKCWHQLKETGIIKSFPIALRDVCDRFIIPDKLYGRETEVKTLLQAFERVSQGATEIMLVSGFSGIGKTAVINEVHKPIVRQRGYFIKGKYDQFQRNVPFSAFVQAFRDLICQLLTERNTQIQGWKSKILETVADNGQIIIEVIPELERIIGPQPPVPNLSGAAAENRFNLIFQKFTQVFTSSEHPLIIFLDDLQWADSASLKLIRLLIANTGYLFLIGAYRDNEVNPAHPLTLALGELQKNQATIHTITLTPLEQVQVNQLVADTLKCPEDLALPLSRLVYRKTQGNSFFTTQFLKALYQDKFIQFNIDLGCWQCDISQVIQQVITDDVVTFMALQLQKLPRATQRILQLAACIGNQFDVTTLAIVSEYSEVEIATFLWQALQEGIILPLSDIYKFYQQESLINNHQQIFGENGRLTAHYKFLHDRLQQAAYSLIPNEQKPLTHLKIGQLLWQNLSEIEKEEKLFDIIGHLNQGKELITELCEREVLAQLNLKAGSKARNSTAYSAARAYLQTGIELLQANCWQTQYELTLNLYTSAAEAAYLNGDFEDMEQIATQVFQAAQTILDKVKIYEIQIGAQTLQSNVLDAIAIGRKALWQLGVKLPQEPDAAAIDKALQTIANQLQGMQVEQLIGLPLTTDTTTQAAMQLMGMLFSPIIQGAPSLLPLLSSTMVNLSLQAGNTVASTIGYAIHGMVMSAFFENATTGYAFGKLALNLLEKLNTQELKTTVMFLFGCFIQHHQEHLSATIPILKAAYHTGIETGNFVHAGYSLATHSNARFFSGAELGGFVKDMADYSVALAQVKQYSAQVYVDLAKQVAENLIEPVSQPHDLIGNAYNETEMLSKHYHDNDFTAIAEVYVYKLLLAYSFGYYTDAINYIAQAQPHLMALSGSPYIPVAHFYTALTHLALYIKQSKQEQAETFALIQTHQVTLHQWAQNAPMNHMHKWYLVEAEKQRILGDKLAAIECYDQAILLARDNEFINEEALANELAAKFYLDWGKEQFAQTYITNAYYCYARWGAKAKVHHLEKSYHHLLQPILQQQQINLNPLETISHSTFSSPHTFSTSISEVLDFTSILKAAQAISSSIELNDLIANLTRIILKNSGAKKSVLILPQADTWIVRATALIHQESYALPDIQVLLDSQPIEICQYIPIKITHCVINTQKPIVINNGQTDIPGVIGQYMLQYNPKSVLCTPIIHQGHLVGILYLENQLTSEVFTQERLQVINLLASQVAISLENARLYQQAQQALQDLQQAQLQIVQSEKMSALGNLVAGVAHEMNNPLGFIAASLQQTQPTLADIIAHLKLYHKSFPNPSDKIKDHAEEIDLDFSLEDLPKMIESMIVACDRLQNISTSLRTFSRADHDYKVSFNIHEGIESTILILKHRLKANAQRPAIEVVTEYGNLPEIECFPGQLNQVFMNILANAIDALEESNNGRSFAEIQAHPNQIIITTSLHAHQVQIAIADNGIGMDEQVQQKIFDHLFTTKAVGKGTGLGLAIARQVVVEKHNGLLTVNSTLGKGTEFVITLPIVAQTLN